MVSNGSDIYSHSVISIRYDIKDNFPQLWALIPDRAIEVLQTAAKQGLDVAEPYTPYKPNDPRTTQHLRDSTFIQAYRNGEHGGTVYVQWRAQNPDNGFHYGIIHEFTQFDPENYSTPGTGPGFMEKTWSVIEQVVSALMIEEMNKLISETSV